MTTVPFDIAAEATARNQSLLDLRRDFHQHPELSWQETRTAGIIAERLQAAGLEVQHGICGTGVVGVLRGDLPGRTIAWRADIDALPIQEKVDLPFASVNEGVMHACGHDGHTAIGITVAETLAARRKHMAGTAVFIFQPAEETLDGAKPMIAAGVLENPHVEAVLGLHLTARDPMGQVLIQPGPTFASADFFDIEVKGEGGHGAFPHLSVDPITVAAHILIGLQDLVAKEIPAHDAAVLTIGQVQAGTKHNIIPADAVLRGSLRTYRQNVRDQVVERMGAFASRIAQAYRAEANLRLVGEYCPPVESDENIADKVRRSALAVVAAENVAEGQPMMGSDDMSLFLKERPGCYFRVGCGIPGQEITHHHPEFQIDERSLDIALRVALQAMHDALQP